MRIVGVSFDDPAKNAAWRRNKGFAFELWTDVDRTLAQHLGAAKSADQRHASRRTVLLDAQGHVAVTYDVGLGLGTHPQDVLDDARRLWPAQVPPRETLRAP